MATRSLSAPQLRTKTPPQGTYLLSDETVNIHTIHVNNSNSTFHKLLIIPNITTACLIDTENPLTFMHADIHRILGSPPLIPVNLQLVGLENSNVFCLKSFSTNIDNDNNNFETAVYIISFSHYFARNFNFQTNEISLNQRNQSTKFRFTINSS